MLLRNFAMNRPLLGLAAAILTAGFIGCASTPTEDPIEGRQDTVRAGDPRQIFFDSTGLRDDTALDAPVVTRDANGLLHVTVPIRSVIDKQLYIEYRVVFFDHNRQEIDRSPWRDKTLAAHLPDRVSINSTSPRAESFQLHFRYPTGTELHSGTAAPSGNAAHPDTPAY
jgi:Protein of unknown function (DUF1425)